MVLAFYSQKPEKKMKKIMQKRLVSSCTFYEYPVYLIHSVSLVNIIIGIGAEKKVFFSHLICNKITFKNVKLTKTLCFHSPPKLHQPSDSIVLSIHNLQTIEIHYSYILVYSSIKIRSFPSTKVAKFLLFQARGVVS